MRQHLKPKLVRVIDKHGDELLHNAKMVVEGDRAAIRAERDWQAGCRMDAVDIPEEPRVAQVPLGRMAAVIFLLISAFIAGLAMGKLV